MYQPAHFQVTDLPTLQALIEQQPLATWATVRDGEIVVNHVPFLLDRQRGPFGTLVGHVARANPVWQAPAPSVLVFQGAQGYISPNWYPSKRVHGKAVPTWNYAVVHAHGTPQVLSSREALRDIVSRLTRHHEASMPHPWQVDDAPADYVEQMLNAIVGIEVPIERLVGKWKMSQNQPAANREGVVAGLRDRQPVDPMSQALADVIDQSAPRAPAAPAA